MNRLLGTTSTRLMTPFALILERQSYSNSRYRYLPVLNPAFPPFISKWTWRYRLLNLSGPDWTTDGCGRWGRIPGLSWLRRYCSGDSGKVVGCHHGEEVVGC